ncbi:hypothetical protein OROGR_003012 [Orobanche gracilis]
MLELREGRRCYPETVVGVNVGLACVDGLIAFLAFYQVTVLVFAIMIASSVLIWVGMGKSPINSAVVAQVYVDLISVVTLLLGGALACYGLVLFLKMRKVRADRASWERWKVAGLAIVCVVSFTSSASVGMASNIPVSSSLPSAFILLVMRELPPPVLINRTQDARTITSITSDGSFEIHHRHPDRWTAATSVQNQAVMLLSANLDSDILKFIITKVPL